MSNDPFGAIIWFFIFIIFLMVYPRMMLAQLIYQLEVSAKRLEEMVIRSINLCTRKVKQKGVRKLINEFTEFFVIAPSNLDPFGIVKKIDQVIRSMEYRFDEFVKEVGTHLSEKEQKELNYGLRTTIGLKQIAKLVRHYVELSKKFKNLQIAMMLRMQMPIIEHIAKGELNGTEAFVNGIPVGDGIGPLVAASFMRNGKKITEDIVYSEIVIEKRKCIVLKANGPHPNLGRIDEAISKFINKYKIAKVITIDAAGKLEGEKTGNIAEGVGFAMGGVVQREIIENILLPKKIPVYSIVIKVGLTEAIEPMKKSIFNALPRVREKIMKEVRRTKRNGIVLIVGIGNTCGISNDSKALKDAECMLKKYYKKKVRRKR